MKPYSLTLVASLSSILLLPVPGIWLLTPSVVASQQMTNQLSADELRRLSESVTVRVFADTNKGSGTLILKLGQVYTVVTNAHVTNSGKSYRIQTPDGKTHRAEMIPGINFQEKDVALLQFEARENYAVASKTSSNPTTGEKIWAAGFAYDSDKLVMTEGEISLLPKKALEGGYQIGYSNEIRQEMSGGPIFNQRGELIGINGRRAFPMIEKYRFEDASIPNEQQQEAMRRYSWGIPIATVVGRMEANRFYQQGLKQYQAWEHEEAIAAFNEAIRRYPGYAEAYYHRALAKMKDARYHQEGFRWNRYRQEARADMQQAATLFQAQGKQAQAYRSQGYVYRFGEEPKKAIQAFNQALRFNSNDVPTYMGRGLAYATLEEYEKALADYNKAIEIQPNSAEIYYGRASVYYKKEDYQAAVGDYTKAIELKPDFFEAYVARGEVHGILLGNLQAGMVDVNKAIEIKPDYDLAYETRSQIRWWLGDFQRGLADSNKAIQLDPKNALAYAINALFHNRLKNYQQAIADANQAIALGIDKFDKRLAALVYLFRGKSYFDLENYSTAIPDLEKAIRLIRENKPTDNTPFLDISVQEILRAARQAVTSPQRTLPDVMAKVDAIAKQITVQIDSPGSFRCQGSGVIISRKENTYTILTSEHVLRESPNCNAKQIEVVTHDSQQYQVNSSTIKRIQGADLAVLQFTSSQAYQVATLANYKNKTLNWVFVSGIPASQNRYQLTAGQLCSKELGATNTINSLSFTYGYQLIYNNLTGAGMSGAPVLDTEGRVIGIHGRAEGEIPIAEVGESPPIQLGFSLGVPIRTFIRSASLVGINPQSLSLKTNVPVAIGMTYNEKLRESLRKTIPVPGNNADAVAWLNYGNQLWRLDLHPEAIGAYEKATQLKPNSYQAWYARGKVLLISPGLSQAALESFDKAVQLKPDFSPGWYERGQVLEELKRYEEAIKSYNKAIELEREFFGAYYQRGSAYYKLKNYKKALADYTTAIELQPDNAQAYFDRGSTYSSLKEYQKAITDHTKAIELDPEFVYAYHGRGNAYSSLKEYQKAITDYNQAIELIANTAFLYQPGKVKVESSLYVERGIVYFYLKDYQKAIADFTKAIQIEPKNRNAYVVRGHLYAYKEIKDYQKALADFRKTLELDPKYINGYIGLGRVYYKLKDYETAIAQYNKAIEIEPKSSNAYKERGYVYGDLGDYQKARADFRKIIEINPKYIEGYIGLGYVYRKLKHYPTAIAQYNQVLKLDPNYAQAYNGLGNIQYQQGNYQKAIEYYNQAISKDAKYWGAIANIGMVKYEIGEVDAAMTQWQAALKIDEKAAEPQLALAVALYAKGKREQALKMAETALKLEKRLGEIDYLKEQLWGNSLLADAQRLLATPSIQALISKSQ
ncbi:tetratricopeptide repeat protein [Scytonema sp. UIC 10036]|uniref:tetratricopeptide repeat protein n=1 Tax=Scytonema sp. UIC 10036 TaxID=2304196 RepID=UPI0012DA145C|nr:tetratricopeptide repeat protein [Scytonema sp. UIC 10036]MUG96181.1 tetratricopeptide repeat protein [Scytonema sp. UIC 10036]